MHKPDRIGALVLGFAVIALYLMTASWLDFLLGLSLPVNLNSHAMVGLALLDAFFINLYAIRMRKISRRTKP
jgi:hypothetical protein